MKLAVIGSGNIGKSIGSWAAEVGYDVLFSAKNEAHAKAAAEASGHGARAASVRAAVEASDLVLLALPYEAAKEVLPSLAALLKGKTVIDATNPLAADFSSLTVGHNTSAAEEIAKLVPGANVVKAFNTVFAQIFANRNPKINGKPLSLFISGDEARAKDRVFKLASKLGFDVVDAGPLQSARNLEPLAMLNITLGYGLGLGTGIGFSLNR